jgi:Fe2+ or Zn2+ uptake regulation protein
MQRRAILSAVRTLGGHPTAADVFSALRDEYPNLSLATVYRALHALVEQGVIGETRVDNVSRYDTSPIPHHHVVCRHCGNVADLPQLILGDDLFRTAEAHSGFLLDGRSVQLTGLCPACSLSAVASRS